MKRAATALAAMTMLVSAAQAVAAPFRPTPDPPPGAKHAYVCPGYYTRVQDVTDIYRWNGSRYMVVGEIRSRPYLIFHPNPTGRCRQVQ